MFAVIHLPQFALQAALRPTPELWARPIALVDPTLTTPRVCDLTAPARQQGVEPGQTPTQALARCREVVIRHRSRSQEIAATDAVLQCAHGFSPHFEQTAPGVVTLDLRGLSELAHDRVQSASGDALKAAGRIEVSPMLQRWAERLQAALTSLHLTARLGLGPTPNLARHAAQWGGFGSDQLPPAMDFNRPDLPAPGPMAGPTSPTSPTDPTNPTGWGTPCIVTDARAFISALPVAALGPSTDVANILEKWGVRTVGQLLALGQDAVMDRLGLEAIALFAAASPQTTRPLNLVRPVERYEESFDFEHEVETVEPLLFVLNRFVDQISQRLELGSLVAEQITLRLRLASGENIEYPLRVPQPTRRAEVLFRMLQTHLEGMRTDSPIAGLALQADPTRPGQKQFSLFEAALRDPHQFQETLARLSALVGADRVGTPVRENSHRPDAFKLIPPDFENAPTSLRRRVAEILRQTPLRRLRPSWPAAVKCDSIGRDSIGAQFHLNPMRGEQCAMTNAPSGDRTQCPLSIAHCSWAEAPRPMKVTVALGPWRASGHWWEPGEAGAGAWQRDEWDIQIEGGPALRLVHSGDRWQVEAMVD